ncbi:hypothetical protein L1987_70102 [Smallanthus sonchifolius]|uniref:Uncharacterized protein n=1 Tax=Smallanthus sonchifolius TaxID=185202 RepID=A0ACB9APD4_9ASTR|nr:hypothetical protein L1987_70102 [Smallanthus sonchifolius]
MPGSIQVSGVRTMSIIEKGIWDDVFPIEGGGLIHMKLQFFLSEEDRNRIRLMRESAMKKKQAEILGSRREVSVLHWNFSERFCLDVLSDSSSQDFQKSGFNTDISLKASESCDGIKEESFQEQSFTVKDYTLEETSFPHMTQEIVQKPNSSNNSVEKLFETLKKKMLNDVKETNKESTSNKNNVILRRQAEFPKKLLEDTKTRDFLKNNDAVNSRPMYSRVEKLEKPILEDEKPNFVKKMSKESKFPPFSKETEVDTSKNNEIQLQETDILKRLQDSSSSDVGSSRLPVGEKIKSFSPKLAGEMDKQGSLEKAPQNIKKMISVFESTIYQDRVPLKPVSSKSYRFGTSRLLKDNLVKDYYEKSESSLKNSEKSSSSRLRNSFSTGDLRKNLSNIITEGDQVEFDDKFEEPSEKIQSKGNDSKDAEKMGKEAINNEENLPKSPHEGVNNEKESIDGKKTSKVNVDYFDQDGSGQWTFLDEKRQFCMTAHGDKAISLLSDCRIEEKGYQEKIVTSIPEIVVKGEETESPESADAEASNGSFGQAMKIALVVGFGVLVFLFRQRDSGGGNYDPFK